MWAPNSTSRILNNARSPWTIFIRLVAFFLGEWTGFAQFFIGISRMQCAIYMHRQRVYSGPAPQPLAWHAALQMWPFHLQLQNAIRPAIPLCSSTQIAPQALPSFPPSWTSSDRRVRTAGQPASTGNTPGNGLFKVLNKHQSAVDQRTPTRQLPRQWQSGSLRKTMDRWLRIMWWDGSRAHATSCWTVFFTLSR